MEHREELYEINKLSFYVLNGTLKDEDNDLYEELKKLAYSKTPSIRKSFAQIFAKNPNLPKDIALTLAKDNYNISIPVIENYSKFDDDDLDAILTYARKESILKNVIQRAKLSHRTIHYLTKECNYNEIILLIEKHRQHLTNTELIAILERFNSILEVKKILELMGVTTQQELSRIFQESNDIVKSSLNEIYKLKLDHKTETNINIFKLDDDNLYKSDAQKTIKNNIDLLFNSNRLTELVIIRFLLRGDLFAYIYSLSKLNMTPFLKVRNELFYEVDPKKVKILLIDSSISKEHLDALTHLHVDIQNKFRITIEDPGKLRKTITHYIGDNLKGTTLFFLINALK